MHGFLDVQVGLLQEAAEGRAAPLLLVGLGPDRADGRSLTDHLVLESRSTDLLVQLLEENGSHVASSEAHVAETESKVDVLVLLDEVLQGEPQGAERISDDVGAEGSAGGDRNRVGKDSLIALLVDGVLALRLGEHFFDAAPDEVLLKVGIDDKDRLDVVNVLSLGASVPDTDVAGAEAAGSDLRQLSLDAEGEAAEALHVDASAGADIGLNVLHERLPDDDELGMRLDRLEVAVGGGAHSSVVVLARVLGAVLEDPIVFVSEVVLQNFGPEDLMRRYIGVFLGTLTSLRLNRCSFSFINKIKSVVWGFGVLGTQTERGTEKRALVRCAG